jgi:hypothetical protein
VLEAKESRKRVFRRNSPSLQKIVGRLGQSFIQTKPTLSVLNTPESVMDNLREMEDG